MPGGRAAEGAGGAWGRAAGGAGGAGGRSTDRGAALCQLNHFSYSRQVRSRALRTTSCQQPTATERTQTLVESICEILCPVF